MQSDNKKIQIDRLLNRLGADKNIRLVYADEVQEGYIEVTLHRKNRQDECVQVSITDTEAGIEIEADVSNIITPSIVLSGLKLRMTADPDGITDYIDRLAEIVLYLEKINLQ